MRHHLKARRDTRNRRYQQLVSARRVAHCTTLIAFCIKALSLRLALCDIVQATSTRLPHYICKRRVIRYSDNAKPSQDLLESLRVCDNRCFFGKYAYQPTYQPIGPLRSATKCRHNIGDLTFCSSGTSNYRHTQAFLPESTAVLTPLFQPARFRCGRYQSHGETSGNLPFDSLVNIVHDRWCFLPSHTRGQYLTYRFLELSTYRLTRRIIHGVTQMS